MRKLVHIVLLILGLFGAHQLLAQRFYASVNPNPVEQGGRFTVKFVLENASGDISTPDLSDFIVIFGPSKSSNFSYYNGKSSRTETVSFVLLAEREGTFTIGSAQANTGSKQLKSDPIKVEVVKGSGSSNQGGSSSSASPSTNENRSIENAGNVIMELSANKRSVVMGEPLVLSYTLYSRYTQLELGETTYPPIPGFWVENLDLGSVQWDQNLATINGMRYRKAVIKKQLLYPQQSGKITIPSFTQNVVVNRSFFNAGTKVAANSNALTIDVKPYPNGAPADFSNSVGLYRISSEISSTQGQVNEALTFKLRISGKGNLKLLNAPNIEFPSDFEVYEPKTNEKIAANLEGMSGYREWEYILIPRYPGNYEIPKVSFSYLDLGTKKYKRIASDPINVSIEGSVMDSKGGVIVNPKNDVTLLNKDIRYIESEWHQEQSIKSFSAASKWFWLLVTVIALGFSSLAFYVRKQQALKENVVEYKQKKASKFAIKKLATAKGHMQKKQEQAFYIEVVNALHGFIQDRFGLDKTLLSRNPLRTELLKRGASEEQCQELQLLIDDCDMARYAPVASVNMESTYERAKNVMQWLEKLSA